jgi:hypothetical protein
MAGSGSLPFGLGFLSDLRHLHSLGWCEMGKVWVGVGREGGRSPWLYHSGPVGLLGCAHYGTDERW